MKTTRRALATSAAVLATVLAAALPACAQSEAAPRNLSFRHLTAEEYGADYDSLLAVIRAIDSFHLVNQQLKGLDFEAETARFRARIADFEGPGEYIRLVRKTLNLLHDNHASIVLGADEVWAASHAPEDTAVARRAAAYYDTLYTRHVTNRVPAIELPLRYISGRYTIYHRFTVDGVPVDSGFTVTAVNGRDPQTVIDTEYARIPDLLWDQSRARPYTEKFYQVADLYEDGRMNLIFERGDERVELTLALDDSVRLPKGVHPIGFNSGTESKAVLYLEDERILYIRMPQMREAGFYLEELDRLMDRRPEKVVLDVRGNGGGSDYTWAGPLRRIIGSELDRPIFVGIRDTRTMRELARRTFHPVWLDSTRITPDRFQSRLLGDAAFQGFRVVPNHLTPDSVNMGFEGDIFILADRYHYSSTDNLLSLAGANDRVISVGMTSGRFAGLQFSPVQVMLPHSKLSVRFGPALDFAQVEAVEDFYHDPIDIPYEYDVSDYHALSRLRGDVSDLEFLLRRDPLMRIVLEHGE